MNFNTMPYLTLWHCEKCQSFFTTVEKGGIGLGAACGTCRQTSPNYGVYKLEQLTINDERTNDEVSRGFAFTKAISTKS